MGNRVTLFNRRVTMPLEAYLATVKFPHAQFDPALDRSASSNNGLRFNMETALNNLPGDPLSVKYDGVPPEDVRSLLDFFDNWPIISVIQ